MWILRPKPSAAKRHGADGTATAAGAAVYDLDANRHRRAQALINISLLI